MGWLTTDELWCDGDGRPRTHAPPTYKKSLASDRPEIFNLVLIDLSHAFERSKPVGKPPVPLRISVLHALSAAVASVDDYKIRLRLDAPAISERVLIAIERVKAMNKGYGHACQTR